MRVGTDFLCVMRNIHIFPYINYHLPITSNRNQYTLLLAKQHPSSNTSYLLPHPLVCPLPHHPLGSGIPHLMPGIHRILLDPSIPHLLLLLLKHILDPHGLIQLVLVLEDFGLFWVEETLAVLCVETAHEVVNGGFPPIGAKLEEFQENLEEKVAFQIRNVFGGVVGLNGNIFLFQGFLQL